MTDNRGGGAGAWSARCRQRVPRPTATPCWSATPHTYAPLIYPKAGFDLLHDFEPISAFGRVRRHWWSIGRPRCLDRAAIRRRPQEKPGSVDVGSAGMGTVNHLAIEMMQDRAGIELNHIPYRGSGPAIQDMLGGHVPAIFGPVTTWSTMS